MLTEYKPRPLTGPEAAVTPARSLPLRHPHFLETSETKSLHPAAHFISSLSKMLLKQDCTVVPQSHAAPSSCGSSGFRSKRPPDSCWLSAWPSPGTQTAPGSSSRQGRDWSGLCPGESGPPNIMTKPVRTFHIDIFTVWSFKGSFCTTDGSSAIWDQ